MIFDTRDEDSRFAKSAKEECVYEEVRWSDKENTMRQAIGEIRPGLTTHFVTSGTWSCYELLKYALKTTGQAEVDAFTWNISMPAVTQILEMKRDGMWTSFRILVHNAMKRYTAEALSVLQSQVDRVVLYPNHAKGFLIKNDKWTVSVVTSANFSNNANIEAGSISCSPDVYWMHRDWLDRFFDRRELLSSVKVQDHAAPRPDEGRKKVLFAVCTGRGGDGRTLAASIADKVCSADDYFTDIDGNYKFELHNLTRAKSECFARVKQAMEDGIGKIAVANSFSTTGEIAEYRDAARLYGYAFHVLRSV